MFFGVFVFLILSAIVERLAFRNYEPTKRAWFVVGTAWIITAIGQFFTFQPMDAAIGALLSTFAAMAVLIWYRSRYQSQWIDE